MPAADANCKRCHGKGYTIESVYGFPAEKIECQCQRERQKKTTTQVETAETWIEEILSPMEKFGSIVSRWFPGFEVPSEANRAGRVVEVSPPPPSPVPEIRGPVRFRESLSWAHSSGHEVDAGQVGLVAWQFGDRLAVWSGGVLLYAVPVDAVESITLPAPGENPAWKNAGGSETLGDVAQQLAEW